MITNKKKKSSGRRKIKNVKRRAWVTAARGMGGSYKMCMKMSLDLDKSLSSLLNALDGGFGTEELENLIEGWVEANKPKTV